MDGSRSYGKTLKYPDKFLKDPKYCTTSFSWQRLTNQAAYVGSYNERCGTDNEISVRERLVNTTLPGSFRRLLILPTSHNLANAHLPGSFCRQL
jgi:hypothetical protein